MSKNDKKIIVPADVLILATKQMLEHQEAFTKEEIGIEVITEILDCLANAGFLEKTVIAASYRTVGTWTVEEAEAAVEYYIRQEAR